MYALGTIRSKFSQIPSAGGSVTLNGESLISNAQLALSELREDAKGFAPTLGFIVG
jgi:hypothetical protein